LECGDKNRATRESRHRFPVHPRQRGVAQNTACRRTPNPFFRLASAGKGWSQGQADARPCVFESWTL